MTIPTNQFSQRERAGLEQMLAAPESVEFHGTDLAWQKALGQVLSPEQPKPSLKDVLMFNSVPPSDVPRGG